MFPACPLHSQRIVAFFMAFSLLSSCVSTQKKEEKRVQERSNPAKENSTAQLQKLFLQLSQEIDPKASEDAATSAQLAEKIAKMPEKDVEEFLNSDFVPKVAEEIEKNDPEAPIILRDRSMSAAGITMITLGSIGLAGGVVGTGYDYLKGFQDLTLRELEDYKFRPGLGSLGAIAISISSIVLGERLRKYASDKNKGDAAAGLSTGVIGLAGGIAIMAHAAAQPIERLAIVDNLKRGTAMMLDPSTNEYFKALKSQQPEGAALPEEYESRLDYQDMLKELDPPEYMAKVFNDAGVKPAAGGEFTGRMIMRMSKNDLKTAFKDFKKSPMKLNRIEPWMIDSARGRSLEHYRELNIKKRNKMIWGGGLAALGAGIIVASAVALNLAEGQEAPPVKTLKAINSIILARPGN